MSPEQLKRESLYAGSQVLALKWQTTPNGCDQGHVTRVLHFATNHIFGTSEARHYKYRVLIDTQECKCKHDILPQRMCSDSRDLFKFWEISDNIS